MMRSKVSVLREVVQSQAKPDRDYVLEIMKSKRIILPTVKVLSGSLEMFASEMRCCLNQIHGYNSLLETVEETRAEKYDSTNETHEQSLLKLWNLLQPDEALENRVSKQWGKIGFQGDDPKTDFRGMGVLGLQNLLYFAEMHTDLAKQVLLHSQHPQYGYSFAIVGINITSTAYELFTSGLLRSHFYNQVSERPRMEDFHQVYCYLFYEFDKFWMKSEPENVMAFGRIHDEFKLTIEAVLKYGPTASLELQLPIQKA